MLGETSNYEVTGRGNSNSFHCPLSQQLLFTKLGWRENSNRAWINLITDGACEDTLNSLYLA